MHQARSHCEERNDEAISYLWSEIATLPLVARNDDLKRFNAFLLARSSESFVLNLRTLNSELLTFYSGKKWLYLLKDPFCCTLMFLKKLESFLAHFLTRSLI